VHLLVAFVGNVPIEKRTILRDDTPAIAAARRERNPGHVIAACRKIPHLLVTRFGNASVEKMYCHCTLPPLFCGSNDKNRTITSTPARPLEVLSNSLLESRCRYRDDLPRAKTN
jgi:hypothetical protein